MKKAHNISALVVCVVTTVCFGGLTLPRLAAAQTRPVPPTVTKARFVCIDAAGKEQVIEKVVVSTSPGTTTTAIGNCPGVGKVKVKIHTSKAGVLPSPEPIPPPVEGRTEEKPMTFHDAFVDEFEKRFRVGLRGWAGYTSLPGVNGANLHEKEHQLNGANLSGAFFVEFPRFFDDLAGVDGLGLGIFGGLGAGMLFLSEHDRLATGIPEGGIIWTIDPRWNLQAAYRYQAGSTLDQSVLQAHEGLVRGGYMFWPHLRVELTAGVGKAYTAREEHLMSQPHRVTHCEGVIAEVEVGIALVY